jgi:hypothetical protein
MLDIPPLELWAEVDAGPLQVFSLHSPRSQFPPASAPSLSAYVICFLGCAPPTAEASGSIQVAIRTSRTVQGGCLLTNPHITPWICYLALYNRYF